MGIFSSATVMAMPLKNACSYGWSTLAAVANRFVRRAKAPADPVVAVGMPGKDKDSDDDEVNEADTDASNIPANASDMGIEDSATQKICVCDPLTVESIKDDDDVHVETDIVVYDKVGIRGRISSAIRLVKQKILDLRNFCRSFCSSAAAKADSSAMADAMGKLKYYFQDDQVLADLGWFLVDMAKDIGSEAIRNKARRVPGGLKAYDRISMKLNRFGGWLQNNYQSLSNAKDIEDLKRDLKELRARIYKLEKQCSFCTCGCNKLHDQPEVLEPDFGLTSKITLQEDSSSETLTLKSAEFS